MVNVEQISFQNAVWHGLITLGAGVSSDTKFSVTYNGDALDTVAIENGPSLHEKILTCTIPLVAIGDGVHTFVIWAQGQTDPIFTFAVAGGRTLELDLRTEVSQLRSELELIKQILRNRFSGS